MRKICILFFCVLLGYSVILPSNIYAAGVSVTPSATTVNVGDTVTFTVSVSGGAGNVSWSGASSGSDYLDSYGNATKSFTVTATSPGSLSVSVSGLLSDYNACDPSNPSTCVDKTYGASTVVNVVAPVPETTPTPTPTPSEPEQSKPTQDQTQDTNKDQQEDEEELEEEEKEEEKEARLASLSASIGTLSPEFSSDEYSYVLKVGAKVDSVTLTAKAMDGAAKVSGDGEISLDSDTKDVSIKVTNGTSSKTYTVQIQRAKPSVTLKGPSNREYQLIDDELPSISGYASYTIKINDREYPALKQEDGDKILVYCMNDQQIPLWYEFDEKTSEIISLYNPITLFSKNYILMSDEGELEAKEGYKETVVEIDGKKLPGYQFTNDSFEDYNIVYLKEDTKEAEPSYYQHEKTEDTLQKYSLAAPVTQEQLDEVKSSQHTLMIISIAAIAFGFISLMTSIGLVIAMRKRV